jgi:3-oxoacyl-[acyl-carrier-protein] synthase-3
MLLAIKTQLIESHTETSEACVIRGGGTKDPFGAEGYGKFSMNGKALFQAASRHMDGFIERFVSLGGVEPACADWVVAHQASREAIELMRRRLKISPDRMPVRFEEFGNQVSASIPEGLASLCRSGQLRHGDRILVLGTGAGLLIGATELAVVSAKT